ncbi:putative multi-domain containing protein [Aduncisulcus paluster]|uniref:Proteasome assembly chaperone 2 n=1 Tax=Aduncisulcus paluster TaxID=2918883 RepID=A0ABQ5KC11_9EUKA|nr:putative multi-domain containing protein [Aduncisulcus paluster]
MLLKWINDDSKPKSHEHNILVLGAFSHALLPQLTIECISSQPEFFIVANLLSSNLVPFICSQKKDTPFSFALELFLRQFPGTEGKSPTNMYILLQRSPILTGKLTEFSKEIQRFVQDFQFDEVLLLGSCNDRVLSSPAFSLSSRLFSYPKILSITTPTGNKISTKLLDTHPSSEVGGEEEEDIKPLAGFGAGNTWDLIEIFESDVDISFQSIVFAVAEGMNTREAIYFSEFVFNILKMGEIKIIEPPHWKDSLL